MENKPFTYNEVNEQIGGSQSYIRTSENMTVVTGLAINEQKNPEPPEIIAVGKTEDRIKRAMLFCKQGTAVPVFSKRKSNEWYYRGEYKPLRFDKSPNTIREYVKDPSKVAGILFLERESEERRSLDQESEEGFEPRTGEWGHPTKKRIEEIEEAAVKKVQEHFENTKNGGYTIKSRESENLGWDLDAVKTGEKTLRLEVKGTASSIEQFNLTRNERRASQSPQTRTQWRLVIVTNAASRNEHQLPPKVSVYTASEMEDYFDFEPRVYLCKKKS